MSDNPQNVATITTVTGTEALEIADRLRAAANSAAYLFRERFGSGAYGIQMPLEYALARVRVVVPLPISTLSLTETKP